MEEEVPRREHVLLCGEVLLGGERGCCVSGEESTLGDEEVLASRE